MSDTLFSVFHHNRQDRRRDQEPLLAYPFTSSPEPLAENRDLQRGSCCSDPHHRRAPPPHSSGLGPKQLSPPVYSSFPASGKPGLATTLGHDNRSPKIDGQMDE